MIAVAPNRCSHCGGRPLSWSPQEILEAARAWAERYGQPPTAEAWRVATPEHPNENTVRRAFGGWNKMMRQAGFTPRRPGAPPSVWTREDIVRLVFEFHYKYGRVPRWSDWQPASPEWPDPCVAQRMFGSWNAMLVAAGYEPTMRKRNADGILA